MDRYWNHLGEEVGTSWSEDDALARDDCPPLGRDPYLKPEENGYSPEIDVDKYSPEVRQKPNVLRKIRRFLRILGEPTPSPA